ncbi:MAG: hypothetical protein AAGJ38_01475 [Planctomycetota bacterium]
MHKPSWLSMNLLGVLMIGGSYAISTMFVLGRGETKVATPQIEDEDVRVVQLMHWQLEPGYREAMQAVMDEYNALPHVQAAGVRVEQLPVTERFFAQILNVHAISGTAPDLCQRGMSQLLSGNTIARFFDPLGDYVSEPNPYNAPEYLPSGLDRELAASLPTMPWRETYLDGLRSGWDVNLQAYYAVPTSFLGRAVLFYNADLVPKGKALLREAASASPCPAWYTDLLLRDTPDGPSGFITETDAYRQWLSEADTPPDTLGRLLVYGHALWHLSSTPGYEDLAPIAGRDNSWTLFHNQYLSSFSHALNETLDYDYSTTVSPRETWVAYGANVWGFESPAIEAFFRCLREVTRLFPPGFLGLDREQAQRRFINGKAGFLSTGLWDAESLYRGTEGRVLRDGESDPPGETVTVVDGERRVGYRFDLEVMLFPVPGEGERWSEYKLLPQSGGSNGGGVFMLYADSPNKEAAVDFLRFLGSVRVNEQFNRTAGLAPAILGADAVDQVRPFQVDPRGISSLTSLQPHRGPTGLIGVRYTGELKNFLAGDIPYDAFVERVVEATADPLNGIGRLWWRVDQQDRIRARNGDATYAGIVIEALLTDTPDDPKRRASAFRRTALLFSGISGERLFRRLHPNEPFPQYD